MTQPTLNTTNKTSAKSSHKLASTTTATDKSTATEQATAIELATQQSHNMSQSVAAIALTKAELLDLFIIPATSMIAETDAGAQSSFDKGLSDKGLLVKYSASAVDAAVTTANETSVADQRLALYRNQHQRTRLLYQASANNRPTYLVQNLKPQFLERQQYLLSQQLDKRGLFDIDAIERLWQQLHVVDDIIADIVSHMPAQQPAGWQLTVQDGHNPLCLPTVGKLKHPKPVADLASLNSYVLSHFGVSSFTYDRAYYIGHVIGYLFSCYFCAHLSISYGVTALGSQVILDYDYASLETPHMVRLLQGLDGYCKKRIYQLAVICARLSVYASDKRIEKMLIAEVNDFDKKLQQQHLDILLLQGIMPDSSDSTPLF